MDKRRNINPELLKNIVENSHSKSEMVRRLKWPMNGTTFKILDELIDKYNIQLFSYDPHKLARTGKKVKCATCGKLVYRRKTDIKRSKSGKLFCSVACSNTGTKTGKDNGSYIDGRTTYRNMALKHYPHVCQSDNCPLDPSIVPVEMLDVHHIDGDRSNNNLDNLQILCAWCHVKLTRGVG